MSILAKSRVLSGIKTLLETGELLTPHSGFNGQNSRRPARLSRFGPGKDGALVFGLTGPDSPVVRLLLRPSAFGAEGLA